MMEPDESRGSRPVLRGAGAATPRPTHPKLLGPAKWTYFYLYVILDLVQPGWCLCRAGSATGCTKQISMGPRVPAKMTVRCYLVCWHEMRLDRSGRPGRWVTKESGDMGNSKWAVDLIRFGGQLACVVVVRSSFFFLPARRDDGCGRGTSLARRGSGRNVMPQISRTRLLEYLQRARVLIHADESRQIDDSETGGSQTPHEL